MRREYVSTRLAVFLCKGNVVAQISFQIMHTLTMCLVVMTECCDKVATQVAFVLPSVCPIYICIDFRAVHHFQKRVCLV